jgi:bacteriocin biosynthesis cyclodehydratase domain-containing protein
MTVPPAALPERPLLKPWYRLAHVDGRIALEYGHHVVSLEGRAVERLLPALLPLLDGTRTIPEVTEHVGAAAAEAVDHALGVLAAHGVLTEGPPVTDAAGPAAAAAPAAAARGGVAPGTTRGRLAGAVAAVRGSGALAADVARQLRLAGIGRVERQRWDEPAEADALVVAAPAPEEVRELPAWNAEALADGVPWLQVIPFDGRLAVVGPLFLPGETCCYECYRARRASNSGYEDDYLALDATPVAAPQEAAVRAVVAGVAAALATRRLALEDPHAAGVLYAVEYTDKLSLSSHRVLRVPRCPACCDAATTGLPVPWGDE